jgi:hypothetical protein
VTDKRPPRRRKNSTRRILRIGVVLIALIMLVTLGLSLTRLSTPFGQAETLDYNAFWQEAQDSGFKNAWADGQIFYLERNGGQMVRVEVPDPALALTLLTKKNVAIKAFRPQPGSGLSPVVLIALCVPYLFLGSVLLAMISAAASAPQLALDSEELELPASDCPACGKRIENPQTYCPHCAHKLMASDELPVA